MKKLLLFVFILVVDISAPSCQITVPELKEKNTIVHVTQNNNETVDIIFIAKPHVQDRAHYSHLRLDLKNNSYDITPIVDDNFFKEHKDLGSFTYDFSIDNFVIIDGSSDFSNKGGIQTYVYNIHTKSFFSFTTPVIKNNVMTSLQKFYSKDKEEMVFFIRRSQYDDMRINSTDKYELNTISTTDYTNTTDEFSFENKDFSISEVFSSGNPKFAVISYYLKGKGYATIDLETKEIKNIPINTEYSEIFGTQYYQLNENEGIFRLSLGANGVSKIYKYIYINGKDEVVNDLGDIPTLKHRSEQYMDFVAVCHNGNLLEMGKETAVIIENGNLTFKENFNVRPGNAVFKFIQDGKWYAYIDNASEIKGVKKKIVLDLTSFELEEITLDKKYSSEIRSYKFMSNWSTSYLLYSATKEGTIFYNSVDF